MMMALLEFDNLKTDPSPAPPLLPPPFSRKIKKNENSFSLEKRKGEGGGKKKFFLQNFIIVNLTTILMYIY